MHLDSTILFSRFNEEASAAFFSILSEFQYNATLIDRDGEENYFQLIKSQFHEKLSNRLNAIANALLSQFGQISQENSLQANLSQNIAYYLEEFVKKAENG